MSVAEVERFVELVQHGEIPECAPPALRLENCCRQRQTCLDNGMFAVVDMDWTARLAAWLGRRQVLEVMAGVGWLARALQAHGVSIVATDDLSWYDGYVCPSPALIEDLNSIDAVSKYTDADVLLMSWPPYKDTAAAETIECWGYDRPIVYIGEGEGGCCGDDRFFELTEKMPGSPDDFGLPSWWGIHDRVQVLQQTRKSERRR